MTSKAEFDHSFWSVRNPIIYGITGTIGLVGVYLYLATTRSCQQEVCQTNFEHFLASSPNEIGDTLAGIAGILAFMWIIVTVFLQSKELKDARKEYKKMADAQKGQLDLLITQGDIFKKEQQQREQSQAKELFDEKLLGIWYSITTSPINDVAWIVPSESRGGLSFVDKRNLFEAPKTDDSSVAVRDYSLAERDSIIRSQAGVVGGLFFGLREDGAKIEKENRPKKSIELDMLIFELGEIQKLEDSLSPAQRERLKNLGIEQTQLMLKLLDQLEHCWYDMDGRY